MNGYPGSSTPTKKLWKARALYIGHLLATMVCYAFIFYFAHRFGILGQESMSSGDWVKFLVYLFVTMFAVELVLAPLFRRRGRVWQTLFSRPPEDDWPRH